MSELENDVTFSDKFLSIVTNTAEGYRQPSKEVLKRSVTNTNLYTRKSATLKRFLILLENIGKKEFLDYEKDLKKSQIEYIIPQTITQAKWPLISNTEHDKFLHTLGNLTLTFDNQKLSNLGVTEKKRILIEQS